MTNEQLQETLNDWIAAITGYPCIRVRQSGPTPTEPYIALNLTGTVEVRQHEQTIKYSPSKADEPAPGEDTGGDPIYPPITATPVIEIEWRFSAHAYGGASAIDVLRPIVSASKLSQIIEPLIPDFKIHELSQIRDLSEWVNNAWQERANIDIIMHGLTRDGFVIDVIDDIEPFNVTREG